MRLVDIPKDMTALPSTPLRIKNFLQQHPLFERQGIKRLLRSLPRENIEIRELQTVGSDNGNYRRGKIVTDLDPVRAYEELDEHNRWILLNKASWVNQECAELVRDFVGQLRCHFTDLSKGLTHLGCWIFLSSPNSLVHFHMDDDMSFLNQIYGTKKVFVYPPDILPEYEREKVAYTEQQGQVYQPEYEEKMFMPVDLDEGESVFLPLYAPHRVVNGPDVCVAVNIGFHTAKSWARHKVHWINYELRSMGLEPSSWGVRPGLDFIKASSWRLFRLKNKVLKVLRLCKELFKRKESLSFDSSMQ